MAQTDLRTALDKYESLGRLTEDAETINGRLLAAVEAIGDSQELHPADLGVADWAIKTVQRLKNAVHDEICDPTLGKVKQNYEDLLDKGSSKESIAAIGSVITSVCVALGLGPLAVSSVVLYLGIWIVKIGLNSWCKLPSPKQA